jgi:acyl carrier protein
MDGDIRPDLAAGIKALIADTFDVSPARIGMATHPDEVNGWDSLGHSVLLTRIGRKYDVTITEELAAPVADVAELVSRLAALLESPSHG